MADDHTSGPYRSNDPHRLAAEPSHPNEKTGASDPLAELARLIGQRDPFAEFGRSNSRQTKRQVQEPLATSADQWRTPAPEQQFGTDDTSGRDAYASSPDYAHPSAHQVGGATPEGHVYEEVPLAADHQGQYHGDHYDQDRLHEEQQHADQSPDGYGADQYYQDDVPLGPNDDDMYDDPPRARQRGRLTTVLALVGCAVLGTIGAYAFRSYYAEPSATQSPPIITADNSTPTKIIPATAGDPGKGAQDRAGSADKEQLVSKQEEPVALKESAPQAAPRVAAPVPAASAGSAAQQPSAGSLPVPTEPKKVRTVVIRPDGGTDPSAKPAGVPALAAQGSVATAPTSTPRPAAAAPAPKAATAAAPSATDNTSGGFVVQLSSQKSESEAMASFRSLQAKFPDELGGRQPIIRRADLGSKGVFYRTLVGPFASAHEASQFCATYKAAGGQCVVPNN
jgi:hypothetical protein